MDYILKFIETGSFPIFTAFLLGIITTIHPCPLTLNITAIGYISNDLEKKEHVFKKGLVYTLGRIFTYTLLTLVIYMGADAFKISDFFHEYGEKIIGPFLVFTGIIMLDIIPIQIPFVAKLNTFLIGKNRKKNLFSSFILGSIFALAFCPHTAILYFGMLIPLALANSGGLFVLPSAFAIGTGLPVILISWILTYSISSISSFYTKIKIIETWMRKISAIIFIFAGLYFILESLFEHSSCC